ncbi:MAG: M23 family metallopeptidase [candidate division NC10 bacterium]
MPDGPSPLRAPGRSRCWAAGLGVALLAVLPGLPHLPRPAFADDLRLAVRLAPAEARQGGVSVLSVQWSSPIRGLRVRVGDREIPALSPDELTRWVVLIGIDLEQRPGTLAIRADAVDGSGRALTGQGTLRVLDAHFPVQRLTVPRPFVELDTATLERVNREKALLDQVWETQTPERYWRDPFRVPLDGAGPAYGFGLRRIINGEPRSPHTGADFAASPGSPVLAANAGIVALVADHFFAGRSVILDHGLGLYTMYFHLQESLVQPGQRVERGQAIARVGSTGRATGPHLHWGARLYGARIDPQELLKPLPLE